MQETSQVREKLHAVAASARTQGGRPNKPSKSHYRFYCYTDPTIGLTDSAPAESGWAKGTYPTVCSSFIWMMLEKRSHHLETAAVQVMPSDLESGDVATGAEVSPGTPDGLYRYTAAERVAAGEWLYEKIHYDIMDESGWLGDLLTDAADDVANEILNTFARDVPEKDDDQWRNATDANAVSPDNILWWDAPDKGGLYGYAEPLIYREPRTEKFTVSRWKKVTTRGTVTGIVTLEGKPAGGAEVNLGQGTTDFTDANGRYEILNVPFGS